MLEIKVRKIRGNCPVHKVGDKIVIDDPRILLDRTDALCTHVLSTLLDYTTISEHDWCPVKLGLTTPEDLSMLTCSALTQENLTPRAGEKEECLK